MMNDIDLIERYFENNLTPKEQIIFNELLKNNEAFKSEFVFQKDLKKVIAFDQREHLKSTLQNFEKKIIKEVKILFLPKKWFVAASLVLILGLGCWAVKDTFLPSNQKIYAENFVAYRNIIQPVVRSSNINTIEYKAFVAYENKECHKAINLFNSSKNSESDYIQFYKAMCYLSLSKTDDAINILLPIATAKNNKNAKNDFKQIANWYLALAYLKNEEKQKAISQFSLIANHPDNYYKKLDAIKILKYLN